MTDKERMQDMLKAWNIPYKTTPADGFPRKRPEATQVINVTAQPDYDYQGPLSGYSHFYVEWFFDADGKFVHMGIWE